LKMELELTFDLHLFLVSGYVRKNK
jgi:hypothetical protein